MAKVGLPLLVDEGALGITVIAQGVVETGTVELAVRAFERGIAINRLGDVFVRHGKTELTCFLVQGGVGHEAAQHLAVEAERAGFLIGDPAARLALQPLQLILVGGPIILRRDVDRSDLGELAGPEAAENVADAPDREAHDDEAHDDREHHAAVPALGGGAQALQHVLGVRKKSEGRDYRKPGVGATAAPR